MDNLIEALTIFRKYTSASYPTDEDTQRLDELGFFVPEPEEERSAFMSYDFGSC